MCVDDGVARWAAQPIQIGSASVITPIVVGPQVVPVVADVDRARSSTELAMLSAMTHHDVPGFWRRWPTRSALIPSMACVF